MKKAILFLSIILGLYLTGCCPVLAGSVAGGAFYKSTKTKTQKKEFTESFREINMERESRGLKPLDWCSECYKFDPGWARQQKPCIEKIERYEEGDKSALDI